MPIFLQIKCCDSGVWMIIFHFLPRNGLIHQPERNTPPPIHYQLFHRHHIQIRTQIQIQVQVQISIPHLNSLKLNRTKWLYFGTKLTYFWREKQPNFVAKKLSEGRLIEFLECLEGNHSDSLSWDKSPPLPFIWFITRPPTPTCQKSFNNNSSMKNIKLKREKATLDAKKPWRAISENSVLLNVGLLLGRQISRFRISSFCEIFNKKVAKTNW